jgi:RNA polymerase sigma-70 factor (ECF subfamily)
MPKKRSDKSVDAVLVPFEGAASREDSFDELLLEHLDLMFAVAMKLTRNADDAEDLVHNTIVKALRFHDKFTEGTYIKAWLLTILRNTYINQYRQKIRRPASVELSGNEEAREAYPDPKVAYRPNSDKYSDMRELLGDKVRVAVDTLPIEFRKVVILADVEERSYKDIAELLECPIGTVMSRLFRGRKILRTQLHDYAVEQGLLSSGTDG